MRFLGNFVSMFLLVLVVIGFPLTIGGVVGWAIYALVGHGVLVPLGGAVAAIASMIAGYYAVEQERP